MGSAYPSEVVLELEVDLDDDILEDQIMKIATEALSNALRHSGAENVDIKVEADSTHLFVRVHDDGIGFDGSQPTKGMGLANIRDRALKVGGIVDIESSPDGTTIVVSASL